MSHPLRLYGHRGAAAERPENTLEAFRRALEVGADALETDTHLTADGVPILHHDASALRMTGVDALWQHLTLAEVKALDAGWGFTSPDGDRPFAGRGVTVPTLEEALREFPGVSWNVDIKRVRPSMVAEVLAVIRRLGADQRVTLASFRYRTLLEVRRHGYFGETSLSRGEVVALVTAPGKSFGRLPLSGVAAQVPVRVGPLRFDRPWFVDKCHDLGLRVDYWTINHPAQAACLLELGADGLMSDDPAAIAPVMARFRR